MGIEERIIKVIKSLDRIMDSWDNLTLRRTIVTILSLLMITQIVIFILILITGRDIQTNILGFIGLEFGAWGTILAYYFNIRGKTDEEGIRNNIESIIEKEEGEEEHENKE